MGEMDKEVSRCVVPSCAQPVYDGRLLAEGPDVIRYDARWRPVYPALVTDLTGRKYCPRCNRQYVIV